MTPAELDALEALLAPPKPGGWGRSVFDEHVLREALRRAAPALIAAARERDIWENACHATDVERDAAVQDADRLRAAIVAMLGVESPAARAQVAMEALGKSAACTRCGFVVRGDDAPFLCGRPQCGEAERLRGALETVLDFCGSRDLYGGIREVAARALAPRAPTEPPKYMSGAEFLDAMKGVEFDEDALREIGIDCGPKAG